MLLVFTPGTVLGEIIEFIITDDVNEDEDNVIVLEIVGDSEATQIEDESEFIWTSPRLEMNRESLRYQEITSELWDLDELNNSSRISSFSEFSIDAMSADITPGVISNIFPDPRLAQEIARVLGGGRTVNSVITQADLNAIRSISISGVANLEGVQHLRNMTNFSSSGNAAGQISNLQPLSGLINLNSLQLQNNQISDLTPLSNLTNLWGLILSINQISDITPLSGLINLQWLHLSNNQISDITPLSGMVGLWELFLHSNEISDIAPLAGLRYLDWVFLGNNQIRDISPLIVKSDEWSEWAFVELQNQRITLGAVEPSNSLVISNVVRNINGSLIAPSSISHDGIFNNAIGNITWNNLPTTSNVTYSWNANINIGTGEGIMVFSGTVTIPFNHGSLTPITVRTGQIHTILITADNITNGNREITIEFDPHVMWIHDAWILNSDKILENWTIHHTYGFIRFTTDLAIPEGSTFTGMLGQISFIGIANVGSYFRLTNRGV